MRELVVELAGALRDEVHPHLGAHAGRAHEDELGEGGDVTFAIDERAESFMESFIAERDPSVAFYSEDRGMVAPDGHDPEWVLIVDPIDGTRPALAGLESCCVSVAAARLGEGEPKMGDVEVGCVTEIKSGESFVAERGKGVEPAPRLSANTEIGRMFWTYGLRGRPTMLLMDVLSELVDASSVGGSTFDLGSATFDMTRLITGQLDAYIEPGPRIVDELPGAREQFEAVGGGAVLNNSPYDLAAAALCLTEAGAVVTDAHGRPLDDCPLLGSGHEFQMSCVTAANPELHAKILESLDSAFERLKK
jgi:myo-inositol-1(or 4)-monophosphatase